MPSRDNTRHLFERVVRVVALTSLGALLWRSWAPTAPSKAITFTANSATLDDALSRATRTERPHLALRLDSIPSAPVRGWLTALAASGSAVRWSAAPQIRPVAAASEVMADPAHRVRFTAFAPRGASLAIRDGASSVDSSALGKDGVRVVEGGLEGALLAQSTGITASAYSDDSVVVRPVLVLARAGWEGKFIVAALEESGWKVDARLTVTPSASVEQGALGSVDTSRYAVVIAVDESAARYGADVARFVRSGGGAIIGGGALRAPALASLIPASAGDSISGALGALSTPTPRRGLVATTLRPRGSSAVVLERRNGAPTIVAARLALGRVLAVGYAETWRWRMMGGDGADEGHRAWWSALVSSVAYAPVVHTPPSPRRQLQTPDGAPYGALVAALGPPSAWTGTSASDSQWPWDAILFALTLLALLTEWLSRRARGAR